MGNCSKNCLDSEENKDCSYSMIILPSQSLSSIAKARQMPTLSTNQSESSQGSDSSEECMLSAFNFWNEGQFQLAINQFMASLHQFHKFHPHFPFLHYHIAKCYHQMDKFRQAFQHCKIAYDKYKDMGNKKSLALCAELIGEIKMRQQDCVLGVYYYEKALQFYEQEDQSKQIEVMYILGIVYMQLGEYEKVLALFLKLQAIIECKQYRIQKQYIFRVYFTLGQVYAIKDMSKSSVNYLSKAVEMVLVSSPEYAEVKRELQASIIRLRNKDEAR